MAHYGHIYDGEELIDEVLVLVMKEPNTYTRENVVEIDCHGGAYVTRRILELVLRNGARPAEPGEFTKRAFLNGRIDLAQAEAVIDVINAKNNYDMKILKDGFKLLEYDYLGGSGSRGYGRVKFEEFGVECVLGEVDDDIIDECQKIMEG